MILSTLHMKHSRVHYHFCLAYCTSSSSTSCSAVSSSSSSSSSPSLLPLFPHPFSRALPPLRPLDLGSCCCFYFPSRRTIGCPSSRCSSESSTIGGCLLGLLAALRSIFSSFLLSICSLRPCYFFPLILRSVPSLLSVFLVLFFDPCPDFLFFSFCFSYVLFVQCLCSLLCFVFYALFLFLFVPCF